MFSMSRNEDTTLSLPEDPRPSYTEAAQVSAAGGREEQRAAAVTARLFAKDKVCRRESNYLYAGPGKKPNFLKQLESYMKRKLQAIDNTEPRFQELKLQVYQDVFGRFIEEFKTYQLFLYGIKKEYEDTIAYLRNQICELEPLQTHLRLVTEECDQKMHARWQEEQAEIATLKREKKQLQKDMKSMREKDEAMQAMVAHLKSEVSNLYLQYREEHDARKLLIFKLNHLTSCLGTEEEPTNENSDKEKEDPVMLRQALIVCRDDLSKAQELLNRMQAEYWDVVSRRDWESLENTQKQTLLQVDEGVLHKQSNLQPNLLEVLINTDVSETDTLTVQEFRADLKTEELVASAQNDLDTSSETIAYQRLYSQSQEAEGKDGELPSWLSRLTLGERQLYTSQLREQLAGKEEVSMADLRAALTCINPELDADALNWSLCLAFQVNIEELEQCDTLLDTEAILQNLCMADVSRPDPLPPQA
ncbi:translin-associated factor X-interacting protein 1 isoform X2 [Lampris incognitus]|uniref:translin-associated factor X-interacting protein 1 isoform X2 n=1 Tax=Lampris incognitus TaxID=2546036 RepID=UPI0024B4C908|nr:translin-associated factor X-interacting protein 1 isoform X2 [Lampris incognitus]